MGTKIALNQLKPPFLEVDLQNARDYLDKELRQLSRLNSDWLCFCREKSEIALETVSFILRQRRALYLQGFPSEKNDYLPLIEEQMKKIKAVYLAFFSFSKGLIYEIKNTHLDVFVWLMLEPEFVENSVHFLLAFDQIENIDEEMGKMLVLHSKMPDMDYFLASCIDGLPQWALKSFNYMKLRHSLSIALATHWFKEKKIEARIVFPVLSLFNVEQGQVWLDENARNGECLFERLLLDIKRGQEGRSFWFRALLEEKGSLNISKDLSLFAMLLERKKPHDFDPHCRNAPIKLALSGKVSSVMRAVQYMQTCEEEEGIPWLQALYILYGKNCPAAPQELGVLYEWPQALMALSDWIKQDRQVAGNFLRLGEPLCYASTLKALEDPFIDAQFRHWLWIQLCLYARVYIFWDPFMPAIQQAAIFKKLETLSDPSYCFDQRYPNAVMGD